VQDIAAAHELCGAILLDGAYTATIFLSDKRTVKATRRRYKGKILKGHPVEILLTFGKPNYEAREIIKRAKKAGGSPVEMSIKYPPKTKGGK
jgi:hypothetical protein